jgi:hypothetical protein
MPDPDNDDKVDFADEQPEAATESPEEQEKRERRHAIASHPHTQLRGILSDLASPAARAADITTKHAMLHAAVTRLINLTLQNVPPPDDSEEWINEDFERKRVDAEGPDQQVG